IHVDDVGLVIHADPPVEHKAYLHRSGRTARAGAPGTVVTLMTDDQAAEVGELTRKAGIAATTTRLRPGDPLLIRLAPGGRSSAPPPADDPPPAGRPRHARGARRATPRAAKRAAVKSAAPARSTVGRTGGDGSATATPARPSGTAAFSARTRVGA